MSDAAVVRQLELEERDVYAEFVRRQWCDGLPIVPPTPDRVREMLRGADGAASLGVMPPLWRECTLEKMAVNAVMAGCRPEYLPAVIAGVEAICDPEFSLVGVSGTTDAVAPLLILNGPVRKALDVNSGAGAFGPGWRANATIGRAVRLCWLTIGGAAAGLIRVSTFSQPGVSSSENSSMVIGDPE